MLCKPELRACNLQRLARDCLALVINSWHIGFTCEGNAQGFAKELTLPKLTSVGKVDKGLKGALVTGGGEVTRLDF